MQVSQLCSSTQGSVVPHSICEGGIQFDLSRYSLNVQRGCSKAIKREFRSKAHFEFHRDQRLLVCTVVMSRQVRQRHGETYLNGLRGELIAFVEKFTKPFAVRPPHTPKTRSTSDVRVSRRSARPTNAVRQVLPIPTQRQPVFSSKPFSPAPRLVHAAFTIY